MSRFLLEEQIVFDEDSYVLHAVDANDAEHLRLGAIASSCLAQLLRARGAVVRKRELMDGAWGQFGLEVTDNSLAQVVRQLRLALEKLQPGREYIVTLPRIGYKVAENVQLREIETDVSSVPLPPPTSAELSLLPSPKKELAAESPSVAAASDPGQSVSTSAAASPIVNPNSDAGVRNSGSMLAPGWLRASVFVSLCLLAFLLAAHWQKRSLQIDPLVFAAPLERPQLLIYLPEQGPTVSATQLEIWAEHARQLAALDRMRANPLHFYVLGQGDSMGLICDAPLYDEASRCIGGYAHARTH